MFFSYVKSIVRLIVRFVIRAKSSETIKSAFDRHKTKIEKLLYRHKFSVEDLKKSISRCGIKTGDTVMVHAAWRKFYNFNGTPTDVIEILKDLVGHNGTIVMPCYGENLVFFDVDNTPSSAGVLSEVFRSYPLVKRSRCSHFSVAAFGKHSVYLLEDHEKSHYGFDLFSPCYKLQSIEKSKVLFLGLGEAPTKISVFHCAGSLLRETDEKLNKLLSNDYKSILVVGGKPYVKQMYTRIPGHSNNNKVFKKIFNSLKQTHTCKLSNLDIVVIDASEAINMAVKFAKEGQYCYKNMDKL